MVFLDRSIRPFYSLNIDSHIMGVGGDDSWTASVHEGINTNTYTTPILILIIIVRFLIAAREI